jgi:hypothetical protein
MVVNPFTKLGRKQSDLVKAYRTVFNTPEGQLVLYNLMNEGYMLKPTHDPKSSEGGLKNEGKRELVLHILHKIKTDPVQLLEKIRKGKQMEDKYELD